VWTSQYPAHEYGESRRMPSQVVFAEAYANGGVPVLLFAPSVWKQADTKGLMWHVNKEIAQFVSQHRALFVDRSSVADVALVLSLPSLFWRNCTSLRVLPIKHWDCFTAAASTLEDTHVPYDVLVLGHPDLYDDGPNLARLARYRTVVVPNVDCVSDRQTEAFLSYTEAGGRMVLIGECGTRDEELREREKPAFAKVTAGSLSELDSLTDGAVVRANLPSTLWLNVWRHGSGPMTSVQMVNYDLDLASDRPRPVKPFRLALRTDGEERFAAAWLVRPEDRAMKLDMEGHGKEVQVTVPSVNLWAIVVFAAEGEWEVRSAAAETRKWLERLRIAARCPGQDRGVHDELIAQASELLGQIQGHVKVDNSAARATGSYEGEVTAMRRADYRESDRGAEDDARGNLGCRGSQEVRLRRDGDAGRLGAGERRHDVYEAARLRLDFAGSNDNSR